MATDVPEQVICLGRQKVGRSGLALVLHLLGPWLPLEEHHLDHKVEADLDGGAVAVHSSLLAGCPSGRTTGSCANHGTQEPHLQNKRGEVAHGAVGGWGLG